MTKIEKFVEFTKTLSDRDRAQVEIALESMMRNYSCDLTLSDEQEAEIERRIADPNPKYVSDAEMEEFFGKPLNA